MTNFNAVEWYQQKLERDIAEAAESEGAARRLRRLADQAHGAAMAMDCRTDERRFSALVERAEALALEADRARR